MGILFWVYQSKFSATIMPPVLIISYNVGETNRLTWCWAGCLINSWLNFWWVYNCFLPLPIQNLTGIESWPLSCYFPCNLTSISRVPDLRVFHQLSILKLNNVVLCNFNFAFTLYEFSVHNNNVIIFPYNYKQQKYSFLINLVELVDCMFNKLTEVCVCYIALYLQ